MTENEIKLKLRAITNRILDCLEEGTRAKVANLIYIAGGAIVSLALGEEPQDYDVFCDDDKTADAFRDIWKNKDFPYKAELLANTKNAVTFKLNTGEVIQVVTRFTGPPSRVFESFDYEHCKCYYYQSYWSGALQIETPEILVYNRELIEQKTLVYTGEKDKYCLNTLKRMHKFVSRGWVSDNASILNLYRAIQNSPPIDDPIEHAAQSIGYYGSSLK